MLVTMFKKTTGTRIPVQDQVMVHEDAHKCHGKQPVQLGSAQQGNAQQPEGRR